MRIAFSYALAATLLLPICAMAKNVRETPSVEAIKKCSSSVVNISTEHMVLLRQNPFWGNYGGLLDDLHSGFPMERLTAMKLPSLGSGVIVSSDGLIVTNAHVVQRASKILVTLSNGKTYEALSLGTDLVNDLAIIKIGPDQPLAPIHFADDILLGETVITIGNPFGLQNSVSVGVVSGTGRRFFSPDGTREIKDLVQTDAAISPGSSGGALVNLEGELVGINLAVVQNAPNIGFAVPVEKVRAMLAEYEKIIKARQKNS